jgi:hypothetical protein
MSVKPLSVPVKRSQHQTALLIRASGTHFRHLVQPSSQVLAGFARHSLPQLVRNVVFLCYFYPTLVVSYLIIDTRLPLISSHPSPFLLLLPPNDCETVIMGEEAMEATPPSTSAPPSRPEPKQISKSITLQAPLSRRGKGPGLILVLDHYALIEKSEKHLDPPPLQKWAEEGFAVVQLLVPGKIEDGGEFPLQKALEVLKDCEGCEFDKGVGFICKWCLLCAVNRNSSAYLEELGSYLSSGRQEEIVGFSRY